MNQVQLAATAAFTLAAGETERDAVLLECCTLPDKQLVVTADDLDGIVSRFPAAGVPVKLQHTDTSLDPFGVVTAVRRVGVQLLGKISFAPAIAALVRERGALALSCGLDRSPLSLSEVSLVVKGRLPAATLLSDTDAAELVQLRKEHARLLVEGNAARVDAQVVALKLAGKIIPATEAAARVLLAAPGSALITLADGNTLAVADAFRVYLDSQPPLITLGQLESVRLASVDSMADGNGATTLTQDQRAFFEKSLGVNPDDVVKTMADDKAGKSVGPMGRMMGMTPKKAPMAHDEAGRRKSQERGA